MGAVSVGRAHKGNIYINLYHLSINLAGFVLLGRDTIFYPIFLFNVYGREVIE